ncbi:hypothetical protein RUM44_013008 [Polyplax serrata]|uniref:Uncharacterized protein n=1 Tax=Polyplax serrata TaxID=468196 RepID=A0ABR1BEW0_POLSC
MACNCTILNNKLDKLKTKYVRLRRDHKKLLDVTVILTDAIEEFIKIGINNNVLNKLASCVTIYPDLFRKPEQKALNVPSSQINTADDSNSDQFVEKNGRTYDPATESEKEYYEGFLARPRIPRTPQQ